MEEWSRPKCIPYFEFTIWSSRTNRYIPCSSCVRKTSCKSSIYIEVFDMISWNSKYLKPWCWYITCRTEIESTTISTTEISWTSHQRYISTVSNTELVSNSSESSSWHRKTIIGWSWRIWCRTSCHTCTICSCPFTHRTWCIFIDIWSILTWTWSITHDEWLTCRNIEVFIKIVRNCPIRIIWIRTWCRCRESIIDDNVTITYWDDISKCIDSESYDIGRYNRRSRSKIRKSESWSPCESTRDSEFCSRCNSSDSNISTSIIESCSC